MQNLDLKNKTVFITGVAGFIGSNLAERLLKEIEGIKIVGLDNMNDYYDVRLKEYRLRYILICIGMIAGVKIALVALKKMKNNC